MLRLPNRGPIAISILGVSFVQVPGASTGAAVRYRWGADYVLDGLDFTTRGGTAAELANTRLRIVDNGQSELFYDGAGFQTAVGGLALRGVGQFGPGGGQGFFGRTCAFQRVVKGGDLWVFQIVNDNAGPVYPYLAFRLATPDPLQAGLK